jgi:hypothetical protein
VTVIVMAEGELDGVVSHVGWPGGDVFAEAGTVVGR